MDLSILLPTFAVISVLSKADLVIAAGQHDSRTGKLTNNFKTRGKVMLLTMGLDNSPYFVYEEIGQELERRAFEVRHYNLLSVV